MTHFSRPQGKDTPILNGETADCLALANTAILMRLIQELIERGVIARPGASALFRDAVSNLENCPEFSSRVEDAVRIIRKELMPGIVGPTSTAPWHSNCRFGFG